MVVIRAQLDRRPTRLVAVVAQTDFYVLGACTAPRQKTKGTSTRTGASRAGVRARRCSQYVARIYKRFRRYYVLNRRRRVHAEAGILVAKPLEARKWLGKAVRRGRERPAGRRLLAGAPCPAASQKARSGDHPSGRPSLPRTGRSGESGLAMMAAGLLKRCAKVGACKFGSPSSVLEIPRGEERAIGGGFHSYKIKCGRTG
jgi:hypothetical protein